MMAASDPSQTFQPCVPTSTGMTVAAKPKTDGTDRSTNSPMVIVHSRAMVMKTSGSCALKIAWKVRTCGNWCGSASE